MQDRVVVITGASSGIGAALAEHVAAAGGLPVLAARRARELGAVATRCGSGALVAVADVRHRAEVQTILETALARHGRVDVWVNNAGRGITRLVSQLSDDDFDEMMAVNVKSALYGMQVILPHFKERQHGHIINVSSMLSRIPFVPVRSAYSAAKSALNTLTANLRMELRTEFPNIHVTTVLPGVVATEFGVTALGGGADSRSFPFAQSPTEVAEVIVNIIEEPRADVYTRPGMQEQVVAHYAAHDLTSVEGQSPFTGSAKPGTPT